MSRPHELVEQDQSTRGLRAPLVATAPASPEQLAREAQADQQRAEQGLVCRADLVRNDLTGLSIGPYELGVRIGNGGMGTVFRARHVRLGKSFAIKFITNDVAASCEAQARFEQEVRALGALQHPNIVSAVDAGRGGGLQFLVTELIEGEDFAQLVERLGTIDVPEACELIRQAAIGLRYSHAARFVHRDIKPSNLILDRNGIVKVLDFGLVRNTVGEDRVTQMGGMIGTWDFVAPEQAHDARSADERGDVYGLGCTLLYLLSGRVPFGDERYSGVAAKLKGHLFDRAPWFDRVPAHVPPELAAFLERMLAKSPEARVQTAAEVATAMSRFAQGAEVTRLWGTPAARVVEAVLVPDQRQPTSQPATSPPIAPPQPRNAMRSVLTIGAAILFGMFGTTILFVAAIAFLIALPDPSVSTSDTLAQPSVAEQSPIEPEAVVVAEPEPQTSETTPSVAAEPIASTQSVTRNTNKTLNASAARIALPSFGPSTQANVKSSLVESTSRED